MSAIRPLALITLLVGALFVLKALTFADGASVFFESRAEAREAAQNEPAQPADQPAAADEHGEQHDEAAGAETREAAPSGPSRPMPSEISEYSSASRDQLLTALAERRRTLDARETELDTREGLIEVAEQRVQSRIARMEELQVELQTLLGQLDEERQSEVNDLVATYANLEPDAAAIILRQMDQTDPDTVLLVARELQTSNARKFAAIVGELADMDPVFAASMTSRLRARSMPPETVAQLEAELEAVQN
jgi:flagellar motility protein MotE (MotC chaperone)